MKKLIRLLVSLVLILSVMMSNMVVNEQGLEVQAAYNGLAKFEELKIDDNKSWSTLKFEEGGIGSYKSLNGKETYILFTEMSGYTYHAGDYISIKYDGIDIADEEFMFSGDEGNLYLEKTVSYHYGYITMELPDDANRVFKSVNPKLFRIRGTHRDVKAGDEFTIGGIEIHKAGTLPSWDDGSIREYDPYITPRGISVTYYDDIYSRGFTWSTNDSVKASKLLIVEKPEGVSESNVNWNNAKSIDASVTARTDADNLKWNIFKAHVLNLKPGATYLYKVGIEAGGFSEVGKLKIEDEEDKVDGLTFLHLTDSQESAKVSYEVWSDVLKAGKSKYPDSSFVAFSGDFTNFSYSSVVMKEWIWGLDTASNTLMNMPIAPSSGNHDTYDYAFVDRFDIKWADFDKESDADILSGGNYYYTYGKDVLFVNLNTNINVYYPESEKQLEWLREVLNQYKDCKWKIVQIHKGLMSTGDHSNNYDVIYYRDKLCPIFAKYNVDLVLQGHDHVYTRSASYPFWNYENELNYDYKAYTEAGDVKESYLYDGENRLMNFEPVGTHYVTINYCANKAYATIPENERDERIHLGSNPIEGNGCDSQPELPMYGVVRIKDDILCYDAYTFNREENKSELYDTFAVDKRDGSSVNTKDPANDNNESVNNKNNNDSTKSSAGISLKKNQIIKDKKSKGYYKITKLVKKNGKITGGNVTYLKPVNRKCKKVTIKAKVKLKGVSFKVTAIGKKAFYGCKKLKLIKIKSTTIKKVGKKAFAKINKKAKFVLPKKGRAKLKRLIKRSK